MFKDADASLLTLTLTSRGGWGCAELNSVPKGGIIHWSEREVGRESGVGGEGGGSVTLLQGCCQIPSGCCATRGVCSAKGFAPGVAGDAPPHHNEALNVVPACTCAIREAAWQQQEDMLHSRRRMVAGRREIQGKFQKSPLELPGHT